MSNKKAKRKKKKQGIQQHKSLMERNKKEFCLKLVKIAKATGALDAFKKIPKKDIDFIYSVRIQSFRLEEAEKGTINKIELRIAKRYIYEFMNRMEFSIIKGNPKITYYDYYSAGAILEHYLITLKDEDYKDVKEIKEKFKSFIKVVNIDKLPQHEMESFGLAESHGFSTINKGYFQFNYDYVDDGKSRYFCYKIKTYKPEVKHFIIDNIKRPAYRVGFLNFRNKMNWMKIKSGDLDAKSNIDIEFDVYIQSHVFARLEERLDSIMDLELNFNLFHSLLTPKIKNFNGTFLIEFTVLEIKAGYLVAEVVDGVVLIKTFLFLTNDGTPEAKKLKELVGLNSVDKKYLEIDKVSTFMHSNIEDDKKLKSIFDEAGCESLFIISSVEDEDYKKTFKAKSLLKYLSLNK